MILSYSLSNTTLCFSDMTEICVPLYLSSILFYSVSHIVMGLDLLEKREGRR